MITPHIRIVPLWMKSKASVFSGTNIYIDAGLAFGTGLHPSTRLIAGFIDKERGRFSDFLDVGTGTGILSLIAKSCGAGTVWGFDLEQDAVDTAARNAAANRVSFDRLEAQDFTVQAVSAQFDFVAANILAPVLVRMQPVLIRHVRPEKYLAVSGIWKDEYKKFRKEFDSPALHCLSVRQEKGWYAVLYRKRAVSRRVV
jgi:ribosomal protein L11 methyltransferase